MCIVVNGNRITSYKIRLTKPGMTMHIFGPSTWRQRLADFCDFKVSLIFIERS